jgi:hypothetical protein
MVDQSAANESSDHHIEGDLDGGVGDPHLRCDASKEVPIWFPRQIELNDAENCGVGKIQG